MVCTCTSISGESSYRSLPFWHTPYGQSISFTYNPGAFETAASVMGLGVGDIVCLPFKSGVSVSYILLSLPEFSPADFQSQRLWGLFFPVQQGVLDVELDPLIPQGGSLYL